MSLIIADARLGVLESHGRGRAAHRGGLRFGGTPPGLCRQCVRVRGRKQGMPVPDLPRAEGNQPDACCAGAGGAVPVALWAVCVPAQLRSRQRPYAPDGYRRSDFCGSGGGVSPAPCAWTRPVGCCWPRAGGGRSLPAHCAGIGARTHHPHAKPVLCRRLLARRTAASVRRRGRGYPHGGVYAGSGHAASTQADRPAGTAGRAVRVSGWRRRAHQHARRID